jgi:hypothetical protein
VIAQALQAEAKASGDEDATTTHSEANGGFLLALRPQVGQPPSNTPAPTISGAAEDEHARRSLDGP